MRITCLLAMAAGAVGIPLHAQMPSGIPGLSYRVDIRQADWDTRRLGVDYLLTYTAQRADSNPTGAHYAVQASLKGFQVFGGDADDVNPLTGEIAAQGRYYRSALTRQLPPEQQKRYLELFEKQGEMPPTITEAEERELDRLLELLQKQRWFATYDLHYRLETTENTGVGQNAFGAGGSLEVPLLGNLLDVIPGMTRSGERYIQPVRAYVGLDYVKADASSDDPAPVTDTDGWRGRIEMAWSTLIFDRLVLRASWDADYLIGASDEVKAADREFNNFFQAWIKVPLLKDAGIVVKYLSGRIPPVYKSTNVAGLGFNFSFY